MNRHTDSHDKQQARPQPAQPARNPTHSAKNQRSQHTSANRAPEPEAPEPEAGDAAGGDAEGVEGEGSYIATHRYNEGVREHVQNHDIEREAEAAREALQGDEREELEQAEQRGKRGPLPSDQQQTQGSTRKQSAAHTPQPMPAKR